jgi:Arc/MetJ-type ribon-helix-helix transcriptional regulator
MENESFKYHMVSIDTMNTQVNVRLPSRLLDSAQAYADERGFGSVQELIKETLRERLFEQPDLTAAELRLVRRLAKASDERRLYGTEKALFKRLKR